MLNSGWYVFKWAIYKHKVFSCFTTAEKVGIFSLKRYQWWLFWGTDNIPCKPSVWKTLFFLNSCYHLLRSQGWLVHGNIGTGSCFKHRYSALSCLVWNPIHCSKLAPSEVMSHLLKSPKRSTLPTAQLQLSTMFCSVASVLTGPATKITRMWGNPKRRQRGLCNSIMISLCVRKCSVKKLHRSLDVLETQAGVH